MEIAAAESKISELIKNFDKKEILKIAAQILEIIKKVEIKNSKNSPEIAAFFRAKYFINFKVIENFLSQILKNENKNFSQFIFLTFFQLILQFRENKFKMEIQKSARK